MNRRELYEELVLVQEFNKGKCYIVEKDKQKGYRMSWVDSKEEVLYESRFAFAQKINSDN